MCIKILYPAHFESTISYIFIFFQGSKGHSTELHFNNVCHWSPYRGTNRAIMRKRTTTYPSISTTITRNKARKFPIRRQAGFSPNTTHSPTDVIKNQPDLSGK
ncbi:hypothetical protein CDAR_241161 [Caerostris darwini]|uniref:Uncharacterized protein n=1 Tax=Caerostris darwini TaxID=1538125 RepID=A0AAV4TLR0_9ARAC|nr:hypothetical protein CDAR_241161 [Caerostris darwini]